jgi:hypothetical protein
MEETAANMSLHVHVNVHQGSLDLTVKKFCVNQSASLENVTLLLECATVLVDMLAMTVVRSVLLLWICVWQLILPEVLKISKFRDRIKL